MSAAPENDQFEATRRVVTRLIDAAADEMELVHPEHPFLARWEELDPEAQHAIGSGLVSLLAPLASILQDESEGRYARIQEGDAVVLRANVARANGEQAFIEFTSVDGPFSIRVPVDQLTRVSSSS